MKIAVIGSGISGLFATWALDKHHSVTLYEKGARLGGHTATKNVEHNGKTYPIDTGFIVFNDWTYPNFIRFLDKNNVAYQDTQMSFSVNNPKLGLAYNGHNLDTLFAQRKNLLKPKFYRFLGEICRFNRTAKCLLASENKDIELSLGDFLKRYSFSNYFAQNYILPMGAAIWSSGLAAMKAFPVKFFVRFFNHHGLLNITDRPQWKVITGGSQRYIDTIQPHLNAAIELNADIQAVKRTPQGVQIQMPDHQAVYDQVIFACHSDQALALLDDPSDAEQQILSAIPYKNNSVVLHTDSHLLPKEKKAWAAWNYYLDPTEPDFATLTYNMNILQGLQSDSTFCVSLNQTAKIQDDLVIAEFNYAHPVFNQQSLLAQADRAKINGINNSWYCGAYWYNGFHEDGVKSALDVVKALGVEPF